MTEKVKLPKEVCDALDYAVNECAHKKPNIVAITLSRNWHGTQKEFFVLNKQDTEVIMRALVLGYEPELSAEEQIKELYNHGAKGDDGIYHYDIRQKAILDTLKILGIHYDWMDDSE
jgi:hypothetical protein